MRFGRRMVAVIGVLTLVAAACSSNGSNGGGTPTDGGTTGGDLGSLKIVWMTEANSYIPQSKGPVELGPQFGLTQSNDDISEFEAHATAIQVLLDRKSVV